MNELKDLTKPKKITFIVGEGSGNFTLLFIIPTQMSIEVKFSPQKTRSNDVDNSTVYTITVPFYVNFS